MKLYLRLVLLCVLCLPGVNLLTAQRSFPGKPLGINESLKAAEHMYVLPPPDPVEIEAALLENQHSARKVLRFALERTLSLDPESHGRWVSSEGLRVWRIHVLSPGALSVGLLFSRYELAEGVRLFVYDPDQQEVKGAFTAWNNKDSGILPISHIRGEEVVVELQVPDHLLSYGRLELGSLSHAFLPLENKEGEDYCPAGTFGCSQDCMIDVDCSEGDNWSQVKKSVVRIYTTKQYCTGVLVNNTAYDGSPYVLTAEHCLEDRTHSYQEMADRSIFRFNYQSADCFGEEGPTDQELAASDVLAVGDSLDFCLLRLSADPPASYKAFYAGWDRSDFQPNDSTATIHHPWGDVKKVSIDYDPPSQPAQPGDVPYSDLEEYHYYSYWWIKEWDVGSTQGGSSGGPLFNSAQRLLGVLSGGKAACGDSIGYDEDRERVIFSLAPNYDDYYTRIGVAWDLSEDSAKSLKSWLDPLQDGSETIWGHSPTSASPFQVETSSSYQLWPNPAGELIYVSSRNGSGKARVFHLIHLSGKLLQEGRLHQHGPTEIDISTLPPGLYILGLGEGPEREYLKIIRQ